MTRFDGACPNTQAEFAHNSWVDDPPLTADQIGEYERELASVPVFVTEAVANAGGPELARIMAALASDDDAELGAAVRAVVSSAAKAAVSEVVKRTNTYHQTLEEMIQWWRS